jgi:protein arginine kinase activator
MICQNCQKSAATVHVTEIVQPAGAGGPSVREQHLCEACAQTLDLPHAPGGSKAPVDIWKLLQATAQQTRRKAGPACRGCGMSLEEFRRKGRLGCAACYEAFAAHLGELFERVHGARRHVGRLPGVSPAQLERARRLDELRQRLEHAIREEAYENAARLRDELRRVEDGDPA